MTRKVFLFLTAVFCLCMANKTMAQVATGTTGDCRWTLTGTSSNYTLTITGNGQMGVYSSTYTPPWYSYRSGIKTVDIQLGVTTVAQYGFLNCSILTSVSIPNSVTRIYSSAFTNCTSLTSITIPQSVTSIASTAFQGCTNFTSFTVDTNNSVYSSVDGVLFNKPQTSLMIFPEGKTGSYTIPNSVINIGMYAFVSCIGLTSLTIPNSVTFIDFYSFFNCSGLSSLIIPNSVTNITDYAFGSCTGLTSLTIGNSVRTIGGFAFDGCSGLTGIYVKAETPPAMTALTFNNVSKSIPLHVPCGKAGAYQSASYWSDFTIITGDIPFDISVASNDTTMGSATITKANTSCSDNTAIIAATPNTGYFFVQWNDSDTSNPRTITVTQDAAFTAEFDTIKYQVTVSSNNPPMGTVAGSGDYAANSTATISATPSTDYRFVQWNDGDTSNPRTITVTQDTAFSATFALTMYHVTVSASDPSMGSVTGSGDYLPNSTVTIGAIPNTGYRFLQWNDGNTSNPRTFTVTQDISFTAELGIVAPNMYHVTVTTNNPNMGIVTGGGDYAANSTATISATPNNGYSFVQWNDGNTNNPRSITVTQDTAFIATFVTVTYHVTVSTNNPSMGAVTGSGDYALNTTVTIGAIPNSGYRFVQWDDGNTSNPRTITVTQNISFTAEFEAIMYHITVSANDPSMGTVTGSGDYAINSPATISAIPNSGYSFVQWNDGITTNPRTITVMQDMSFTAMFEGGTYTYHVTVSSNDPNMGTVTGSGDYAVNSTAIIGAIPNAGYRFVQWDDGNINNPRTITVTQDVSFTAVFGVSAADMYHVTVTANDPNMGTVTGSGDYAVNTTVTISAIPNTGYRFVRWNDGNTTNPRTITVTQDISFIAEFEAGTSITDIEASTISIYPNPATDDINITLPENIHQAVFTLYDMQGKVLIRKEISNQGTVSVSNLAKGVYIYNVTTDKQKHVGQLIIKNY